MKTLRRVAWPIIAMHAVMFALHRCKHPGSGMDQVASLNEDQATPDSLAEGERLVTILGTNDIHGALEPEEKAGKRTGGLAFWGSVVARVRSIVAERFGERGGVLVVDAGDQFQGTLISNHNEGKVAIQAMNAIGYDAVVPGNHDFDFGPVGWLEDIVLEATPEHLADKRGAFQAAFAGVTFPLLSANTYLRDSLKTENGASVTVASNKCEPSGSVAIDWTGAKRPEYAKSHVVKSIGGVRVAVIGLDNEDTAETTMSRNVSDLCFRDVIETYRDLRIALKDDADVFVMVIHDGDLANRDNFRSRIKAMLADSPDAVDAVVAGHSHQVQRLDFDGVPMIQSGSGGTKFGRIDLVWSDSVKAIVKSKTRFTGGIALSHEAKFEGAIVEPSSQIEGLVSPARDAVLPLAAQKIGHANAEVKRAWSGESPLVNAVADLLRASTGAKLVFINSATVRANLPKGDLTYEHLFRILPFSSRTIKMKPFSRAHVLKLAKDVVANSGAYGVVSQSGLRISYKKQGSQIKLVQVKTVDDVTLMSNGQATNEGPSSFDAVVIDYLADPVSGVPRLNDQPQDQDLGVVRELIAEKLIASPLEFPTEIDGRIKQL